MDDDIIKSSIWAHLGCRITVLDGSSFRCLTRSHLLCFVRSDSCLMMFSSRFATSTESSPSCRSKNLSGWGNEPQRDYMCRSSNSGRCERGAPPHCRVSSSAGTGKRRRRNEGNGIKTEVFRGSNSPELKHRRPVLYNSTPSVRQTDAFRSYPLSWIALSGRPTAPQPAASSGTQEVTETGNMTILVFKIF